MIIVALLLLAANFSIYMIIANSTSDESNSWLLKFLISAGQDLLVMPCFKVLLQAKLVSSVGGKGALANLGKSLQLLLRIKLLLLDPLVLRTFARA